MDLLSLIILIVVIPFIVVQHDHVDQVFNYQHDFYIAPPEEKKNLPVIHLTSFTHELRIDGRPDLLTNKVQKLSQ